MRNINDILREITQSPQKYLFGDQDILNILFKYYGIIIMYIAPYEEGNRFNVPERRERKLLLHKNEV